VYLIASFSPESRISDALSSVAAVGTQDVALGPLPPAIVLPGSIAIEEFNEELDILCNLITKSIGGEKEELRSDVPM
jgi:hypothetical protein